MSLDLLNIAIAKELSGANNAVEVDSTLTEQGKAADAKATGDNIRSLMSAVGSPLVASTAAAMTDENKIYVYTGSETGYTSGNWYYYNGSDWTSGGVYNYTALSTDKTLTVTDNAADAKVVGDELADLKIDLIESMGDYFIADGWENKNYKGDSSNARLSIVLQYSRVSEYFAVVAPTGYKVGISAYNVGGSWMVWTGSSWSNANLSLQPVQDLRSIPGLSSYTYVRINVLADDSSDIPVSVGGTVAFKVQSVPVYAVDDLKKVFSRYYSNLFLGKGENGKAINTTNGATFSIDGYFVTSFIPVEELKQYFVFRQAGYAVTCGFYSAETSYSFSYLILYDGENLITIPEGMHYIRLAFRSEILSNLEFIAVSPYESAKQTLYIGSGLQYSTLKSGIAEAVKRDHCKVVVLPGTYDLISEFAEDISGTMDVTGIGLKNGVHIVFCDGAKVTALFDNSESTYDSTTWRRIYDYFNPFYADGNESDFTIENLNIEASNTRYCVHDEQYGNGTYCHKYINCRMKYTNNHQDINYVQCIGGGLGEHGTIVIDGGCYESDTDYGITNVDSGNAENAQQVISFHNGNNANADSTIIIKDVYAKNRGYFRFGWYGSSTIKSQVQISGCGTGLPALLKAEGTASTVNFELTESCNDKRIASHWSVSANGQTATLVPDYDQISDDIETLQKSVYITDTVSGSVASFPDGANNIPVKSLMAQITPVQDLHGQSSPWPAGGSKNLIPDGKDASKGYLTGGYLNADGTTSAAAGWYVSEYFEITGGEQYTWSSNYALIGAASVCFYDANKTWLSGEAASAELPKTLTAPAGAVYCRASQGVSNSYLCQLEKGSTATTILPYSNICPITGWTGANVAVTGINIWDEVWEVGSINDLNGVNLDADNTIRTKNYIPVLPGTEYYIRVPDYNARKFYYDANKQFISNLDGTNKTFTTPRNCYYMRFRTYAAYGATYKDDISINYPSTDHDYHSGSGDTSVNISWQTEAGTVYGGTLDVTTGVLTVNKAVITFNGSETESWSMSSGSRFYLTNGISDYNIDATGFISNLYPYGGKKDSASVMYADDTFYTHANASGSDIFVRDTAYNSADAFKAALATTNLVVVGPLATPVTYQLTPTEVKTLLGQNNIWANTGDSTVEYCADTKLYIQKLTQPTEDDMIANSNIANGIYFMVGNNLYVSTAVIAQGDAIIPGTNCTLMNLAAALNAINS